MVRLFRVLSPAAAVVLVLAATVRGQAPQPQTGPTPAAQGPAAPAGGGRQGGGRGQVQLPPGPGVDVVTASCGSCHGLNAITGSTGYTEEGWRSLVTTMIQLPDAALVSATRYLATNFPPKPGRAPTLVPGSVTVTFREWIVPTLGQRDRKSTRLNSSHEVPSRMPSSA